VEEIFHHVGKQQIELQDCICCLVGKRFAVRVIYNEIYVILCEQAVFSTVADVLQKIQS